MFGHDWQKASGRIVELKSARTTSGSSGVFEFVVDVSVPGRDLFRTVVLEPHLAVDFNLPPVGSEVGVEVDAKNGKVRFDKSDPRLSVKARKRAQAVQFDEALHQPPVDTVAVRERADELRRQTQQHQEQLQRQLGQQTDELRRKLEAKGLLPPTEDA